MPSESTILEVRADEVRVGDEFLFRLARDSWEPRWSEVRAIEPIDSPPNPDWSSCVALWGVGWFGALYLPGDSTVIVRRPAPSPSGAEEGRDATTRAILQDAKEVIAGLRRAHPAYHLSVSDPTGTVARSHVVEADIDATLNGECRFCGGQGRYLSEGFFGTKDWHRCEVDCTHCPSAGAQEETP